MAGNGRSAENIAQFIGGDTTDRGDNRQGSAQKKSSGCSDPSEVLAKGMRVKPLAGGVP